MKRFSLMGGVTMVAMMAMVLAVTGCESNPEPGVTARFGTIHAQLNGQPTRIARATQAALKQMNLIPISANASQFDGKVIARTSDDKAVNVTIKKKNDRTSDVAISVASDNAESMGLAVLNNIKEQLQREQGGQARNEQNPNNAQNPNAPQGSAGRSARLNENNNNP